MGERRVAIRLGAREEPPPHGELRGDLTFFAVPAREHAERTDVVAAAVEEVVHRLRARPQRAPHVRTGEPRGAQTREVLERNAVDAFGLVEIAVARAEATEPEVGLLARRVERQRFHVAPHREVVFTRHLVRVRLPNELVRARRARGQGRGCQEENGGADETAREATCHPPEVSAILDAMWPFTRKRGASRFSVALAGEPTEVEVMAKVASPNVVTSPLTGNTSALLLIELVERMLPPDNGRTIAESLSLVGAVILGDVLSLADETGAELSVVAHRTQFVSSTPRHHVTSLERVPPELVPLMKRATGRGVICYRELPLRHGDDVLVRAFIEARTVVAASGYRDTATVRYIARDDLGVVRLEEPPLKTPF